MVPKTSSSHSSVDTAGPRQRALSVGWTGNQLRLGGGVNMRLKRDEEEGNGVSVDYECDANEYWTALRTDAQYYMDRSHMMFDRSVAT
ncbi:hypothetical protein FQN60_010214 [Etheostoma spectabile]|uniref:Uncharacterized protein n=1 Tax=Etheostoma spectabile TaxID=54343 RepID=A0A5J5D605_9PERO|nr:hypothetical protein FQN60_010214 [Etheostoma spectabile]